MKDRFELFIGQTVTSAIIISWLILLYGGILYLKQHGHDMIHLQNFSGEPAHLIKFTKIFHTALMGIPASIVQLGLVTVVIGQVLRVFLTSVLFIKNREWIFFFLSVMILGILIHSIFY